MEARTKPTCTKCGARFADAAHLKRHLERKTPCEPIIEPTGARNQCRYCQRAFKTKTSMYRHIRQSCKLANTEGGKEKAAEHALQRQLAAQEAKVDALQAQLAELAGMLKTQLALAAARDGGPAGAPSALAGSAEAGDGPEPNARE